MAYDCKRVVAVVASLREPLLARPADWHCVLDGVLDEAAAVSAEQLGRGAGGGGAGAAGRNPPSGRPVPAAPSVASGHRPGLAPRSLGPRRHGVVPSYHRVPRPTRGRASAGDRWSDPEDLDRLVVLKITLLGRRGYLATTSDALDLHAAGAGVWRALDRLVERGIPLLCSDRLVEVRLSATPARPAIGALEEADAVGCHAGSVAAGSWFDARDVGFVGEPRSGRRRAAFPLDSGPGRAARPLFGPAGPVRRPDRAGLGPAGRAS